MVLLHEHWRVKGAAVSTPYLDTLCDNRNMLVNGATTPYWVTIVSTLSVGSILGALIGGFVGFITAKAVVKANHRHEWADALRNDLADYLKAIDSLHQAARAVHGDAVMQAVKANAVAELEKRVSEARNEAMCIYRRIRMRLSASEQHTFLEASLKELQGDLQRDMPDPIKVDAILSKARAILDQE